MVSPINSSNTTPPVTQDDATQKLVDLLSNPDSSSSDLLNAQQQLNNFTNPNSSQNTLKKQKEEMQQEIHKLSSR